MLDKVRDTVLKYQLIHPHDHIVVGVSGGPDSMALLHVLLLLQREYRLKLYAAHLNHMFRGEEAKEDARFVETIGKKWGVPVWVEEYDVPSLVASSGMSAQEAARQVRYEFLYNVAARVNARIIAVGHHADDQAETVLMNLLRGGGLEGLSGMSPKRGKIIRPLFEVSRREIEQYCQEHNIPFRQDPSNKKTIYLRNKIRLQLIPLLKEFNPQITQALFRMADVLREENDLIDQAVDEIWSRVVEKESSEEVIFSLAEFSKLHRALKRRIVRKAYDRLTGTKTGLAYDHVESVLKLAERGHVGEKLKLPGTVWVERSYRVFSLTFFMAQKTIPFFHYVLRIPGITTIEELGLRIEAQIVEVPKKFPTDKTIAFLDYDKMSLPLYARQRKPGDRFQPLGLNGSKKLKDFFIDLKVPVVERNRIPIICDCRDRIVWVAGFRIAEPYKITPQSKRALRLAVLPAEGWNE
ncbi:tRNA lysidine(34) synthetase TilS [Calderihabitans maritimus]|uniref:tRNA(Ile)-lysidine synthase n=1 Tax=Calderihabitans maritimus TaxID=1246530 RepID=A0A1Z5HS85_9FIRM|nr:tRNA lysidine(34) synthetase TilS [Calderihabitans maritimus]GAW92227.1 tRNA(Ile)-lysidine synthase [Calderihabitans maritimus]